MMQKVKIETPSFSHKPGGRNIYDGEKREKLFILKEQSHVDENILYRPAHAAN